MICTTTSHFWLWSGAGSAPSAPDHIRCQCGQYTAHEWRTLEAENARLTALLAERDAIRQILEAADSEDTVTVVRQEMAELRHWEQEIPRCQAEIEQVKAERDALATRLAAAESALVAYADLIDYKPFMEFERAFNSIIDNESAPSEPDERERWLIRQAWVAAMNVAHDALAGSREQAAGEGANPTSDSGESSRLSE